MSGLQPRRARARAFDADRTDLEDVRAAGVPETPLGDLMPRATGAATAPARSAPSQQAPVQDRPRGVGGRPARTGRSGAPHGRAAGPRAVSKRPARIPVELYRRAEPLVKGPGRPSWGQLIASVCAGEDRQAVIDRVVKSVSSSDPLAPRGANRVAQETTPIIPQFLGREIDAVDQVQDEAAQAVAEDGVKVTATAVVIAALRIVVERS